MYNFLFPFSISKKKMVTTTQPNMAPPATRGPTLLPGQTPVYGDAWVAAMREHGSMERTKFSICTEDGADPFKTEPLLAAELFNLFHELHAEGHARQALTDAAAPEGPGNESSPEHLLIVISVR